jgi:hypothetical protein
MIYDFSLYTGILLISMYSIFLRVIQHFDQVPCPSLQFKVVKQYNGHIIEGKIEGRIEVTGRRKKKDIISYWTTLRSIEGTGN